MKHIVFAIIALVGSVIVGCAATDIKPRANDPGNSRAPSAPLPDIGASLAADFDPLHRDISTSGHREASTQTPPATHEHEHEHEQHHGVTPGERTGDGPSKAVQKFTCPMHPEIIRNEPSNCPICGMKLVPLDKKDGAKAE